MRLPRPPSPLLLGGDRILPLVTAAQLQQREVLSTEYNAIYWVMAAVTLPYYFS